MGSASRIQEVFNIITRIPGKKLVVLSAMSGTTNKLVRICSHFQRAETDEANALLDELYSAYLNTASELYNELNFSSKAIEKLNISFELMRSILSGRYNQINERTILAQGEIMTSELFLLYCQENALAATGINALDYMRIDENREPDYYKTSELIDNYNHLWETYQVIITQGYICKNEKGEITNLERGGSDYTATILGACLKAEEIQIWTDINGVHNNDPRVVDDTYPIKKMSYREAAELAYFGAKILHPSCVVPAEREGVQIRLKCTLEPEAEGTLISESSSERPITAIAAKDNITAININSHRMLNAYGFLRKVFEVFERYQTPVDMITTSEVAVSVTIDDASKLHDIRREIEQFAEFTASPDHSIICVVGNDLYDNPQLIGKIMTLIDDIPVRMVSLGGSKYNISLLVKSDFKNKALINLNALFVHHGQRVLSY